MSTRTIALLGLALIVFSLAFFLIPLIDISTAEWALGVGQAIGPEWLENLRDAGWFLVLGGFVASLAMIILAHRSGTPGVSPHRKALFILAVLAVGPGLLANVVLKDQWGRARPRDVVELGGHMVFTPAWVISDQCARNCSFVSGEGAFTFALLAPALLVRRRRRSWAILATVSLGLAVSMTRMAQGAHFLSDSVIGALIVALTAVILHRLIVGRNAPDADWN